MLWKSYFLFVGNTCIERYETLIAATMRLEELVKNNPYSDDKMTVEHFTDDGVTLIADAEATGELADDGTRLVKTRDNDGTFIAYNPDTYCRIGG